jgi:hypothetical protein
VIGERIMIETACPGTRGGNYPWDDLDQRRAAITRFAVEHGAVGTSFPGPQEKIQWILSARQVVIRVRPDRADEMVSAAEAQGLKVLEVGEVERFSFSVQGRIWEAREVRIELPPLWASCGCWGCSGSFSRRMNLPCTCGDGCWCRVYGHEATDGVPR